MPIYQSKEVLGANPAPVAYQAGQDITVRGILPLPTALVLNDVLEAVVLPAGFVPVDVYYDTDDLDTNGSPLIAFDCGLMAGTPGKADAARAVGTEFFAADTTPRAGGLARTARLQGQRVLADPANDRSIGLKVQAAAATAVAALTNLNNDRGAWAAGTAYALNDFITLANGVRAKCTTAGVSGSSYPSGLGTAPYNTTVTDGSATWTIADPCVAVTLVARPSRGGA